MIITPRPAAGELTRLVLALAVAVPLVAATAASLPALMVLPFFPAGVADRADRLLRRIATWTLLMHDIGGRQP